MELGDTLAQRVDMEKGSLVEASPWYWSNFAGERDPPSLLVSKKQVQKTYNTEDSLVVTDPTTSSALTGLSRGERTGSRILLWVWSYVKDETRKDSF